MPEGEKITDLVEKIRDELIDVRQRGVDRLDVDTQQQPRRKVDNLEQLANVYCETRNIVLSGRIERVTVLLKNSLSAYRDRENRASANFIEDLLFDPPGLVAPQLPGKRLDSAMEKHARGENYNTVRVPLFTAFARFLVEFAKKSESHTKMPTPEDSAPKESRNLVFKRSTPSQVAAFAGISLVIIGIIATVWIFTTDGERLVNSPEKAPPTNISTNTTTPSPRLIPGKTYTQQAGNRNGVSTWNDPFTPSVTNEKIPFLHKVEISCKVYAPSFPNVSPDGYWYRIASAPWNDKWWSPANTFLNGDRVDGPTEHNTDFSVPDCA